MRELDGLHGVVAIRGGKTVQEYYGEGEDFAWARSLGAVRFGPDTLHDVRSVTKSVTALLYGIALGEGRVPEPAAPLLRHFPQYPDLAAEADRARLTVEHALTMSLGLEWREEIPYDSPANAEIAMELAPDRYRFVLERPVVEPPGTRWSYSGGATALLGQLIADGTGQPLAEYGRAALFEPLGIETFEWMAGTDGVASAASGLRLTPRDLARIGELVLAEGEWRAAGWCPPTGSARWYSRGCRPTGAPGTASTGTWRPSPAGGRCSPRATAGSGSPWCRSWASRSPSPRATTTTPSSGGPRSRCWSRSS